MPTEPNDQTVARGCDALLELVEGSLDTKPIVPSIPPSCPRSRIKWIDWPATQIVTKAKHLNVLTRVPQRVNEATAG
jgi:hypothetical protein